MMLNVMIDLTRFLKNFEEFVIYLQITHDYTLENTGIFKINKTLAVSLPMTYFTQFIAVLENKNQLIFMMLLNN